MAHPVLLQATSLIPDVDRFLADNYSVHRLPPAGAERDALLALHGAEISGLVTSARAGFDQALLARLPNLKVISSFGVGRYTPDVLTDCVADIAFGLLLAVGRRIPEADRYVRGGRWVQQPPAGFPLGR